MTFHISDMRGPQAFVTLSVVAASLCRGDEDFTQLPAMIKCCPETEFLDDWYNCRHTQGEGKQRIKTLKEFVKLKNSTCDSC